MPALFWPTIIISAVPNITQRAPLGSPEEETRVTSDFDPASRASAKRIRAPAFMVPIAIASKLMLAINDTIAASQLPTYDEASSA